jgi:spermidine synthase
MWFVKFISKYRLEATNFMVGGVVLTYELTATRITAPYIGTTIYVWTSIIGVILASLAIGYWAGGYLADTRKMPLDVSMLLILAAACITITNYSKDWGLAHISDTSWPLQLQALCSSVIFFAPATIVLGSISPYLARLRIHKVSSSGHQLGRISSAGTVGSLFGTFITGFWLFNFVGTRYILSLLVICLLLTSFLMTVRELALERLVLILLAVIALGIPARVHIFGVIKDVDSPYSRLLVRDVRTKQGNLRVLQIDSKHWQSEIFRDGNPNLVFDYTQFFADSTALAPQTNHFLVIGGGAFTFPIYLARAYPHAQIDVIEIDNTLKDISARYFGFKQPQNLHVIEADGRQFLNQNHQRYGMIFVDAYTSLSPPFQLSTTQTVSRLSSSLSPGGYVVLNLNANLTGSGLDYLSSFHDTYQQVFPYVQLYRITSNLKPTDQNNIILIAAKQPITSSVQQLVKSNPKLKQYDNPLIVDGAKGQIFTDDFAPIEQMVAKQY